MSRLELHPFSAEHLDDAGALLAARHRRQLRAEPLLPGRYETPAAARAELDALLPGAAASGSVAVRGGRVVGSFVVPIEPSETHVGLARPDSASFPVWAATVPEARGSGAGLALTRVCFAWARARGYEVIVTDRRVTNLLASRFRPRRGFRPTFVRLYRSIP